MADTESKLIYIKYIDIFGDGYYCENCEDFDNYTDREDATIVDETIHLDELSYFEGCDLFGKRCCHCDAFLASCPYLEKNMTPTNIWSNNEELEQAVRSFDLFAQYFVQKLHN